MILLLSPGHKPQWLSSSVITALSENDFWGNAGVKSLASEVWLLQIMGRTCALFIIQESTHITHSYHVINVISKAPIFTVIVSPREIS